jgi:hypothetical protein
VRWDELAAVVPHVPSGAKTRKTWLYEHRRVWANQPGKYADETNGGDFAVVIGSWPPRHVDKFRLTADLAGRAGDQVIDDLLQVIDGGSCPSGVAAASPLRSCTARSGGNEVDYETFLILFQCIGMAEHRRYPTSRFGGGRYLPLNFARLVASGWVDIPPVVAREKRGLASGGLSELERQLVSRIPATEQWRMTSRGRSTEAWGRTIAELRP